MFRKYILNVSCQGKTLFQKEHLQELRKYSFPELKKLERDGLLTWDEMGMEVTELGRHFIRNICKSFDLHLMRSHTDINKPAYSKAI